MKLGVIDVGGGMRGIYAAGIFDYCMEMGIHFDLCIGVSAGSANVTAYLAGQLRRNYLFYTRYSFRREYMSLYNFILNKSYVDLDYLYGTLSNANGENPLDFEAVMKNPGELFVVATRAKTGEAVYFTKGHMKQDNYSILKASSAVPFVCMPYEIEGIPYYDGALSDPIPIEKAFQWGCDKVVVLLSKPEGVRRTAGRDRKLAGLIKKKYPESARRLEERADLYNRKVELARRYRLEGRVLIVSPDHTCGMDTLTRNKTALHQFYVKGYKDAHGILEFIRE